MKPSTSAARGTTRTKTKARTSGAPSRAAAPAARLIDERIRALGGWRGKTLAELRKRIRAAHRGIVEEWKWSTPVWSCDGIVCTGEAYAKVVKLTFAHGAVLPDPARLFNSSLAGNTRRAIDVREGETLDARALQALVRAAVTRNRGAARPARSGRSAPRLLTGGNPQVAKADGDAPVQAYLAALPGWKRAVARRLDALIVRSVPGVRKAVKWNSPLYGLEGQGWFLGLHAFTNTLKLTFFHGAGLRPLPPRASSSKHVRSLDLREGDALDEAQLARWMKQAAALPGWIPGRRG